MTSYKKVYLYLLVFLWVAPIFTALYGGEDDLLYGYSALDGLGLHLLFSFAMGAGAIWFLFLSSYGGNHYRVHPKRRVVIKKAFYYFGYAITSVGLAAAIYSATYNKGVGQHFMDLASGSSEVRDDFLLSSKDGGVSGLIKIFAFGPLSVFLAMSAVIFFYQVDLVEAARLSRLYYFSIACSILKSVFSIDRLTLVAIFLVGVSFMVKKFTVSRFLFLAAVLAATGWISSRRISDYGLVNFFSLYLNLGLVNLGLLDNSVSGYALGFETFLQPFLFVLSFFDVQGIYEPLKYDWAWNPAQYIFGFMFMDFGYFSVIPLFLLSYWILLIERKAASGSRFAVFIYFHVLYCLISFLGVPAFRGLEFWFGIIVAVFLARYVAVLKVSGLIEAR